MAVLNRLFVKGLALVLAASLLTACGGKEERKAKYFERGKAYLAEKNYDKAGIEFLNVLQIDPKSAEAYVYAAIVEEKKQNWAKAFANFNKAIKYGPELVEPRIHLARMYLAQAAAMRAQENQDAAANAMGLAQEQIAEILKREPENDEGLTLQATMWVSEGETDKAIAQLEKVNQRAPGLESAAMMLSALYAQAGRPDEAEAVLEKAIEVADEKLQLQVRLAQFYGSRKKNDEAEALIRSIISENPEKLEYRISLATLLLQNGKKDEAEQVLKDAIAEDPEDDKRYLMLTQFYADQEGREKAIQVIKGFIAEHPDLVELQFGLARYYLDEGDLEKTKTVLKDIIRDRGTDPAGLKARVSLAKIVQQEHPDSPRVDALLDEVLKENPRDNAALLMKGKMAARAGDYVEAINRFRSVLKDQPDSEEVLMLLATAHLANDERDLGKDTLARLIDRHPESIPARLMLARILAGEKDVDGALSQVDDVLKVDKYNDKALAMKYELLAMKNDAAGMDAVTKLMQEGAPEKAEGYLREARLRYAQKDYEAALKIAATVLEKFPDNVEALRIQTDAWAAQKKYDDAIQAADRIIALHPDEAEGYFRKGKLLALKEEDGAALEQYELALQKAPDSMDALREVATLEARVRGADKVEQRLQAILKEKPDHPEAHRLLAGLYASQQDYARAEQELREQVRITPDSNTWSQLAQIKIAQKDLDGAARVYEEGLKAIPDDISLMVGLAGVRERQKDYDASIALYEKVLEIQPENAVSTNNLAALLSDHRTDAASLEKAVKMAELLARTNQVAFQDTAGWVYYRNGEYDKALEVLKKVVERMPKVPVFQYHLGMTYFKLGDKRAAKEHLKAATVEGADYVGIEEARETLKGL